MPKTNDGNKDSQESSSPVVSPRSDIESEISPNSLKFRGFVTPYVVLKPIDISPYLNGRKRGNNDLNGLKTGFTKFGPHSRKLAQKCIVNVKKDDLEKLRSALKSREDTDDSDSDVSNSEMALKCSICDKSYNSEKKLQNHQKNKHIIYTNTKSQKRVSFSEHVIVYEVKEYHKCRKCPKIFKDYQTLRTHMRKKHRKRKCYICNYCEKSFADRMFFKVHIRLHCDVCGKLLPNKTKFLDHRRNICKVFKIHKCKICELSFYRIMDLKDHSYDHQNLCFVCDICKEQFNTKCGIAHHISFLHSKKRPTALYETHKVGNERLYICNFCEESSVEKDSIEKHLFNLPDLTNRAMTGYKDYYFCDQCMKHFKTETEMLNHKWTHFLTNLDVKSNPKSILKKEETCDNPILTALLTSPSNLHSKMAKSQQEKRIFKMNEIPKLPKAIVRLERLNPVINHKINNITGEITNITEITGEMANFTDITETEINNDNSIDSTDMNEDLYIGNFLEVEYKKGKKSEQLKSRKTLLSKYQCQNCGKYFSSNYCLNRHIKTRHSDYENLRCNVCEEVFVWPSLLQNHKCIRLNIPEMPFDDARPEIRFENETIAIDDLEIESDSYQNAIDFEIPAPVVEVRECDSTFGVDNLQNLGYKIVMQEVPIEF